MIKDTIGKKLSLDDYLKSEIYCDNERKNNLSFYKKKKTRRNFWLCQLNVTAYLVEFPKMFTYMIKYTKINR